MSRTCEVGLNGHDCEAPAGSGRTIRTTCYRCGGPACKACSEIIVTPHVGARRRVRVCRDCREDERKKTSGERSTSGGLRP